MHANKEPVSRALSSAVSGRAQARDRGDIGRLRDVEIGIATAATVTKQLQEPIEALMAKLPPGYRTEIGGALVRGAVEDFGTGGGAADYEFFRSCLFNMRS